MELERLRDVTAPDEAGARERALLRLRAEYERAQTAPARNGIARRRGPLRGRLAVAAVAAVVVLAAALSPPGEAVADWVRAAVGLRPTLATDGAPRADRPPSGGRLLVSSAGVVWIVEPDGKRRRLGAWTGASWSPHGRFVIVWKGRRLAALDRRGKLRWSLQTARPVQSAVWSPSGFRVAYRTAGELRVVAGDGTGDRSLNRASFSALAWRPGRAHVLAHTSGSHLSVLDVDSGVRLAQIQLAVVSGQIAWSADGTRLYAKLERSIAVYDARGHRIGRIRMPGGQLVSTFVPARTGHLVAVARRDHTVSEVALMGGNRNAVLFRADGRFSRLRFSPDGRWLLVAWPLADQWVYLRAGAAGASRVVATTRVTRRFSGHGFPQLQGWCCPP